MDEDLEFIPEAHDNENFLDFLHNKYNLGHQKRLEAFYLMNKNAKILNEKYGDNIDFDKLDKIQQQQLIELGIDQLAIYYINTLWELEQKIKYSLNCSQSNLSDLLFG